MSPHPILVALAVTTLASTAAARDRAAALIPPTSLELEAVATPPVDAPSAHLDQPRTSAPTPDPVLAPRVEKEHYSLPMMVGGGVVAGAGTFLILYGVAGALIAPLSTEAPFRGDAAEDAVAPALPGLAFLAIGLPFFVVGSRRVEDKPSWAAGAPAVRVSGRSVDAAWAF